MNFALTCLAALSLLALPRQEDRPGVPAEIEALMDGVDARVVDEMRDLAYLDKAGRVGSLSRHLRKAREMDELLRDLARYRAGMNREPIANLKTRQFNHLVNLTDAFAEADGAAAEMARQGNWPAWVPLSRACLRLADSAPSVAALVPVDDQECRRAVELDAAIRAALQRRHGEALTFRAALTKELGDEGAAVAAARRAAAEYASGLYGLARSIDERWLAKTRGAEVPFVDRWRRWMREEARGGAPPRRHRLGPIWAKLGPGTVSPGADGPGAGFLLRDVGLLIPWPFFLAEKLDLGEIWLRYEAPSFEWTDDSTPEAPKLVPRIRVRAEFRVKPGARPRILGEAPIVACDRRLVGRLPHLSAVAPPAPAAPAPGAATVVPAPAPILFPAFPPALADMTADLVAELAKSAPPRVPDDTTKWFYVLNSGFRGRRAVEYLVAHYWGTDDRLNDAWERAIMPREFPPDWAEWVADSTFFGSTDSDLGRDLYRFDDSTADLPAITSLILTVSRGVIDAIAVEDDSAEVASKADAARESFARAGVDLLAIRRPADLMAEHAARRASANRSAAAAMVPLPLPVAGVVVHPWPEADGAWETVDWLPETAWLAEAREVLESRFDRLTSRSPLALPARQAAALTRELERRLSESGLRPDLPAGLPPGLGPWMPTPPDRASLGKTPVDGEPGRQADLAILHAAVTTLDRADRELDSLQGDVDSWRGLALEIAWTSNVDNLMIDADATLTRRAALPANSPAPPQKPPLPKLAEWTAAVKLDRAAAIPALFQDIPPRLTRHLASIRGELATAGRQVDAVLARYKSPSREAEVGETIRNRVRRVDLLASEIAAQLRVCSDPALASVAANQKALREACRRIQARRAPRPDGVALADHLLAARRRAPVVLFDDLPFDRIDRATARWLRSRRPVIDVPVPADEIARAFLDRIKQWEEHYKLGGKLSLDAPDDYATSRETLAGSR